MLGPYLPHRLYEAMPVLYITSGLTVALVIELLFSGLLLIGAGCVAQKMRWTHRRQSAPRGTRADLPTDADRAKLDAALHAVNRRLDRYDQAPK